MRQNSRGSPRNRRVLRRKRIPSRAEVPLMAALQRTLSAEADLRQTHQRERVRDALAHQPAGFALVIVVRERAEGIEPRACTDQSGNTDVRNIAPALQPLR